MMVGVFNNCFKFGDNINAIKDQLPAGNLHLIGQLILTSIIFLPSYTSYCYRVTREKNSNYLY